MSEIIYIDSCVFLAWLKEEQDRLISIEYAFERAKHGEIKIMASALVIAEVLNLQGAKSPVPLQKREVVRNLFKNEWIVIDTLTRRIAEMSQDLVWEHNVKPKDAIHIATALRATVTTFYTYDKELLKLSTFKTDFGIIQIIEPPKPAQNTFDLEN